MSCLFYCLKKNNPENLNQNLLDNTDALNASDKNQTELKISPQVLKQAKFETVNVILRINIVKLIMK